MCISRMRAAGEGMRGEGEGEGEEEGGGRGGGEEEWQCGEDDCASLPRCSLLAAPSAAPTPRPPSLCKSASRTNNAPCAGIAMSFGNERMLFDAAHRETGVLRRHAPSAQNDK